MEANKIGDFSIGSIKPFRGHEGESCLQGTILKNGKKVAEWSEDSWGGPMMFRFNDATTEKEFYAEANKHPIVTKFKEEMLAEYKIATNPKENHADLVVSTIAQDVELAKRQEAQLKRWCKTKTVVKEKNGKDGEYVIYNIAFPINPETERKIKEKYPDSEIVNYRFLAEQPKSKARPKM